MNAEILCVGTEILLGDIVNTNAAFLAKQLAALGINVFYQSVVGDNPERLQHALEHSLNHADLVVMTGGLGPTYDDLTKETVASYFNRKMILNEAWLAHLQEIFQRMNRPMTENNRKQAYLPEGAIVFENDNGTAPGLAIEGDGKVVIMMPGPPREMTYMMREKVMPYLQKFTDGLLLSHTVHIFGMGESQVESVLKEMMVQHENPTIAPYAKEGEVQLRVTAKAASRGQAEEMIRPVLAEIEQVLGDVIYGVDVGTLENAVVQRLREEHLTLATAESCTGGLISKRITDIPGASEIFIGGVCCYSNQIKKQVCGVEAETLKNYGAVSEQTAKELAAGVRNRFCTDIGVSVTGIAGPGGGTPEKPEGLVYVGIDTPWHSEVVKLNLNRGYAGQRQIIRNSSASHALHLILKTLEKRPCRF